MLVRLGELEDVEKIPAHPGPAVYEIRTRQSGRRTSLILLAECENAIAAILLAQDFIRPDEGAEVWHEDRIIYRLTPRDRTGAGPARTRNVRSPKLRHFARADNDP